MKVQRFAVLVAALVLVVGSEALAKPCGDDVNGKDVPCACGDTLVSDVVLSDDPVVTASCPRDGLLVRAVDAAKGVTIDLHGKALRGSQHGAGIWILAGGPGGARLTSSDGVGSITGFFDGVVGNGPDGVALIENLQISDSARDGIRIGEPRGFAIRSVDVRHSGRDGVSANGNNFQISATRVSGSGRFGYFVMGHDGVIGLAGAGNRAEDGQNDGFNILGVGHRIVDCVATGNGKDGISLHADGIDLRGCLARDNRGDGIGGTGGSWQLAANRAVDNLGNGIVARGSTVVDAGGNAGEGNRGEKQAGPAIQCEIGGAPCAP